MKRHRTTRFARRLSVAAIAVLLSAAGLSVPPAIAHAVQATTYYVDPAGSDTTNGISPATPWQSLAKVNAQTFRPGDRVLFKDGGTWTGQLALHGSGRAGAPITVATYGTGAKPVIAGNGTAVSAVLLSNEHDITVDGLEVTNSSGDGSWRNGVEVAAQDDGALPGITLENLYVHHIDGPSGYVVNIGHGGILVHVNGNTTPTYYTGMVIQDNQVADVRAYGIVTWSTWMQRDGWKALWGELGLPATAYGAFTPSTGLVIRGNDVHDIGNGGINPNQVVGTLIEHNTVARTAQAHGNAAIWWSGADDTTVQYNDVSATHNNGRGLDDTAFDSDESTYRSLVQYNFSHDNGGGFFETCSADSGPAEATVRYNVSQNDGGNVFYLSCYNAKNVDIYNNTVYAAKSTADVPLYSMVYRETNNTQIGFRDNVFVNPLGVPYDATSNITYQHNLYFGGPTPTDSSAITGDPRLASSGTATSIDDLTGYRLKPGSPAIGAGTRSGDGGRDFVGTPLPATAPDLGALQTDAAKTTVTTSYRSGQGTSPAAIADQRPSTGWASAATGTAFPGTVTVDYGTAQTFDSVSLATAFGQGQGITSADVQTWTGHAWATQVPAAPVTWDSNSSLVEFRTIRLPHMVTSSQVRLVVRKANLEWGDLALYELTLGGPTAQAPAATPPVVPSLQKWSGKDGVFRLGLDSRVAVDSAHAPQLAADADTFSRDLATITGRRLPVVTVPRPRPGDFFLTLGASAPSRDQAYSLDVGGTVVVTGHDVTGAFYGEQSIEQLLQSVTAIPRGHAEDWPTVKTRGTMIDLPAHFESVAYLEQQIRQSAWLKLSEIHLHLTDGQGYLLPSAAHPGLSGPQSYSPADIAELVRYAAQYHVVLLPEVDVPGHSGELTAFDPSLGTSCGGLDITKPHTTEFVESLLKETAAMFPDSPVIHLGGDEYPVLADQQKCPALVDYAKQHGFASTEDVYVAWQNTLGRYVQSLGRQPEIWNWWDNAGGATIAPDKSFVIEPWSANPASYYTGLGYHVVSAPDENLPDYRLYISPDTAADNPDLPLDSRLYSGSDWWVDAANQNVLGYESPEWALPPLDRIQWFARNPFAVVADRTWGGQRLANVFAFEDVLDRIGGAPGIPDAVPSQARLVTGTAYGSLGSSGHTVGAAFDGSADTYYASTSTTGAEIGIDLGAGHAARVTKIRFVPVPDPNPNWPYSYQPGALDNTLNMVGGTFQGCSTGPDSGCVDLAPVQWHPMYDWNQLAVTVPQKFRWLRFVGAAGKPVMVSDIQFYTAPATDAEVQLTFPDKLHALQSSMVTGTVTNTGNTPLRNVVVSLDAFSGTDASTLASPAPVTIPVILPHRARILTWPIQVPAEATAGTYYFQARASYDVPGSSAGTQTATDTRSAALPQLITATPASVALDRLGGSATAGLAVANSAAGVVHLAWKAVPPDGSGVTVTPADGVLDVPAGGTASILVSVQATKPGTTEIPIKLAAVDGSRRVDADSVTLSVSAPYPTLAAAFDNVGITDDTNTDPAGLGAGIDDYQGTFSTQALAAAGVTSGDSLTRGGITFTWPSVTAGTPDNVVAKGQTISLSGSGSTLGLLTTAGFGPAGGTATVRYADGSVQTADLSAPDWTAGPSGGTEAISSAYYNLAGHAGPVERSRSIYLSTIKIDPAKTLVGVTLPMATGGSAESALHIFAMGIG
ncbi:alpha-galactosidase-like protein [Streptomyces sp. 846.5]|nr:family 20 glycosylhydrolase [Streptomyces sp. 846.5]TDU03466.1 alpha-galactosidase-like protein [Streptomyces sp. 846.5]